jgi:hypothetical protein
MKPNKKDKIAIQEINKHISNGLKHWAEVLIMADVDEWAFFLNFSDEDVFNALLIFNSIAQNRGIKSGHLNEVNAQQKGSAFKDAIKDFCGIDPATLAIKVLDNNETKA